MRMRSPDKEKCFTVALKTSEYEWELTRQLFANTTRLSPP